MEERIYFVSYDIGDQKRWRRVFKIMNAYGEWLQLSVFQCRMSRKRHAELIADLSGIIHHDQDHILLVDIGPVTNVTPKVTSLGMRDFEPVAREPTIV